MKEWALESSVDGEIWREIDRRMNELTECDLFGRFRDSSQTRKRRFVWFYVGSTRLSFSAPVLLGLSVVKRAASKEKWLPKCLHVPVGDLVLFCPFSSDREAPLLSFT
jgi:hypothetical protein